MNPTFTESAYENALIELFTDRLGYTYTPGFDIPRDPADVVLGELLREKIAEINPSAHILAVEEAVRKVLSLDSPSMLQNNRTFHEYLTSGVSVSYYENGAERSDHLWLVDFKDAGNNDFLVVNQFTIQERETKRPDMVVFVNGLPLVVIELKSCSREETDTSEAYKQIRNYTHAIPSLFHYNAFCVISDLTDTKAGTITAEEDRFMRWKSVAGESASDKNADFSTLFLGMFDKERLLHILKHFVLFLGDSDKPVKILAAYHQYFAVTKAVKSTLGAVKEDGRAGVFWHTQGSGKSLSMVFYAAMLMEPLNNPTIVVLTDRNDLDNQLFGTFSMTANHLRTIPEQAESRAHLKTMLDGRQAGGILFTTMQKFEEDTAMLSDRRNIVLMADEAHRSQYGLNAKAVKHMVDGREEVKITYGMAKYVRDALPNATFIGFTGTPIDMEDKSTQAVFGDYIDIYDMTQAVRDGATKPIYYESRVPNLHLKRDVLEAIDAAYDVLSENAEPYHIAQSKKELGNMEAILGAAETITTLTKDILKHYEDRKHIVAGKAMIVAYSRPIGVKIYKELLKQAPDYKDKIALVMTKKNDDPEDWYELIVDKSKQEETAKQFKDPESELKIVIVVDMWLTGFDVPCLNTMYIYKPMQGHTLMQAIARVNRVYGDKEGGLVVDYVGIASALKQAMKDFTDRDKKHYADNSIEALAYPKFVEKLEICRDLMHGMDYTAFFGESDLIRAQVIADGIDFILKDEETRKIYLRESTALRQAETLCRSMIDEKVRIEVAFFEAVRAGVSKVTGTGKLSVNEINEQINNLLVNSIQAKGIINIFDYKNTFSIFDSEYLESIKRMSQKNLAVELLKRLLNDEIKSLMKTNLVKSEKFSELMEMLMNRYRNGQISNAEMLEELIKMAEELSAAKNQGNSMGLTAEELAFYDALSTPEGVKEAYTHEEFIKITHALAEEVRKSRTIDWYRKETARARMRTIIKRLLKEYHYPPEGQKQALDMVFKQVEHMSESI